MQELFECLDRTDSNLQDISAAADMLLLIASRPNIAGLPEERAAYFLHTAITGAVATARTALREALQHRPTIR